METLEGLVPDHWWAWITAIVAICAAIAVVLPAPKENSVVAYRAVYRLIQWVALNLGKAKNNADTPQKNDSKNGQL